MVADANSFVPGSGSFTVSCVHSPSGAGSNRTWCSKDVYNDSMEMLLGSTNTMQFFIDNNGKNGNLVHTNGVKYTVSMIQNVENNTSKIYINSVLDSTPNFLAGNIDNAKSLYLGVKGASNGNPYNGFIYEQIFYHHAIQEDILSTNQKQYYGIA
jgi:hypothetical protein